MDSTPFDIFLSHNSRDKAAVERIAVQLRRDGFSPWIDVWDLPAGGDWQDGIELGLRHSRGCAVFLGPHGFGDWQLQEMKVASSMAAHDPAFRYFLVLLPGAPDPLDSATLPAFINLRGRINLREGFEAPRQFQHLINAILGVAMGPSAPIEPELTESPYRGLEPFDAQHAAFFFGRDAEIGRLLDKLRDAPFLAVIGPSGSGKSSLVLAGLIPALRNGRLPGSAEWPIVTLVPGAHPLESLAVALDPLDPERSRNRLLEELQGSPLALRLEVGALLKDRPRHAKLVLVVDQFEEIFTLCRDETEREAFLGLLLEAAQPDGRCIVLITMRADFYPRITEYPALAEQVANHQLLVGALTKEGLTAAIEQPAFHKGLQFEPGLVSTILADVGGDAGALPLLQYALDELWKRQHGGLLTLEGYRASGGVGDAIATRANAVFEQLTPDQQAVARRVLLRLTQPGEATEDTRRRAELDELVTRPAERPAIEAAVNALVAARLLTASRDEASGAAQIDVAHEALIRAWPRLRQWLDEDRQGLLVHRRLTEAAQEWQRSERDPDLLYRGSRLTEALGLASLQPDALNELEREFLTESEALRERERAAAAEAAAARERQRRRILVGLGAFSAVALLLALLAGWQWREAGLLAVAASNAEATAQAEAARAEREAEVALAAEGEAERQAAAARRADTTSLARLLAVQSGNVGGEFDLQMLLAAEANELEPGDFDAKRSLFSAVQAHPSLERFLYGAEDRVLALAYSPDGQVLAAGDNGGQIQLWNPVTGAPIGEGIDTGQASVQSLAFRPAVAGTPAAREDWQLASGSGTGLIQIWTLGAEPPVARLRLQGEASIRALAFSSDGTRMAAANQVGEIAIWNAETGEIIAPAWQAHEGIVLALDFSPDGKVLVSGGFDDEAVVVWDAATGDRVGELTRDGGRVYDLVFTPDGQTLVTSTAGSQIVVWDAIHALELRRLEALDAAEGTAVGGSLAISGNGAILAAVDGAGVVRQWRMDNGIPFADPFETGQSPVAALALNHDGSLLATAGVGRDVRLWSTGVPRLGMLTTARGHSTVPDTLAFSPDNVTIATGDGYGAVFLWDSRTGQPIGDRLRGQSDAIWALAFNHDGSLLASGSEDGTVQLWDPRTGLAAYPPLGGYGMQAVSALAFSPAGDWLATGGWNSTIRLWSLTPDGPAGGQVLQLPEIGSVLAMEFSPSGTTLAAVEGTGQLLLWNIDEPTPTERRIATEQDSVTSACFVEDDIVATGGVDGSIRFWNTTDGEATGSDLSAHVGYVSTLSCDPALGLVLSSGADGLVRLWDYGESEPRGEWMANPGSSVRRREAALRPDGLAFAYVSTDFEDVANVVVQPIEGDGQEAAFPVYLRIINATLDAVASRVASVGEGGWLRIWDVATREELAAGEVEDEGVLVAAQFSPDGGNVATGSETGAVQLWQSPSATPVGAAMRAFQSAAQSLAFSTQGDIIAAGDVNGDVQLWEARTQQPLGTSLTADIPVDERSSILALAFNQDDTLLAAAAGSTIILWDLETREMIGERLTGHIFTIYALAFNPDASLLASVDEGGQIRLWNLATHQAAGPPLERSLGDGSALAFSPDGTILAAGSANGTVALWDVNSRAQVGAINETFGTSILALEFSADGSTLTALDYAGTVHHWDLSPGAWLERACKVANRNLTLAEWQRFIGDPDDARRPYRKTCADLPGPSDEGEGLFPAGSATPIAATPVASGAAA
jgi:WD40 repeat protein